MQKILFTALAMLVCFSEPISAKPKPDCGCKKSESSSTKVSQPKIFQHNIQLQLSDALGFPVPGTEFWVTLDVIKNGSVVTIQIPTINFEVGPVANDPNEDGLLPPLVPGGYLYTADGFLPKDLRPNSLVPPSIVAATNNGLSPLYSLTQDPADFPNPQAGYIVQITNSGALVVQGAGEFGNLVTPIPIGGQVLMPCSITYIAKTPKKLCKNFVISEGASNITAFTEPGPINDGYRDSQVNDAFDGVFAWSWADNSMVADKTNNVLNTLVAIGKKGKNGKVKVRAPVQITDYSPPLTSPFDHAVAINRTNKKNIVVSYSASDFTSPIHTATYYRAASFDGGKTFPYNGPLTLGPPFQNPGGFDVGDALGVFADKFGNIWYSATIRYAGSGVLPTPGYSINDPFFAVSTDGGITFTPVYTVPLPDPIEFPLGSFEYDFPQIAIGYDDANNYGFWFSTSIFNLATGDAFPCVGFVPVTGLGTIGTPSFTQLQGLTNIMIDPLIGASNDGRVWLLGLVNAFGAYTYVCPQSFIFKSPGAIDVNYSGPWHFIVSNDLLDQYAVTNEISFPARGYFPEAPRGIIYDNNRQALYTLILSQNPDYSQNINIYFSISRNNGMTWSTPQYLATSSFANRGYPSMALDEVTGDLVFGWYDGRHDKTYESVEYFGGLLHAKKLDRLVNRIPLSDPLFTVPSSAASPFMGSNFLEASSIKTGSSFDKNWKLRFGT